MGKLGKSAKKKRKVVAFKVPEKIIATQEELEKNSELISEADMKKKTNQFFEVQKMMANIRDYALKRIFSSTEGILENTRISNQMLQLLMPIYLKIGVSSELELIHCQNSIIRSIRSIIYSRIERMIEDLLIEREVLEETPAGVAISKRISNANAVLPLNLAKESREVASTIVLKGFTLIRSIEEDILDAMCESLNLLKIEFNKESRIYRKISFLEKELSTAGYQNTLNADVVLAGGN